MKQIVFYRFTLPKPVINLNKLILDLHVQFNTQNNFKTQILNITQYIIINYPKLLKNLYIKICHQITKT